jgi:hypothetical protein
MSETGKYLGYSVGKVYVISVGDQTGELIPLPEPNGEPYLIPSKGDHDIVPFDFPTEITLTFELSEEGTAFFKRLHDYYLKWRYVRPLRYMVKPAHRETVVDKDGFKTVFTPRGRIVSVGGMRLGKGTE